MIKEDSYEYHCEWYRQEQNNFNLHQTPYYL